jgi:flagellar motility protein MotE (MotC chaperone)
MALKKRRLLLELSIGFTIPIGIFWGISFAEAPRDMLLRTPSAPYVAVNGGSSDELVKLLDERKRELDRREENLRKEEARLKIIQADIADTLKKNSELRDEIKKTATSGKKPDGKVDQLAKVYEVMSVEEAAARMEAMDERLAVDLLSRMKGKTVAKIFANMSQEKAVALSSSLAKKP